MSTPRLPNSTDPSGCPRFATTRWTIVLRARHRPAARTPDSTQREALEALCRTYWFPVYSFVRRSGIGPDDAQDTTQDFFLQLIRNGLRSVDRERGRFRSYLLASVKNQMAKDHRRRSAKKRGGGKLPLSLDEMLGKAEERYLREPGHDLNPAKLYEKRWAEALIDHVIRRLEKEWTERGRDFASMKVFLTGDRGEVSLKDAASRLGCTLGALKSRVSRLRRKYGEIFQEEIAHTVANPCEVQAEIRHLMAVLES